MDRNMINAEEYRTVLRVAQCVVRPGQDPEDLVQDAYVSLFLTPSPPRDRQAWLSQVVRNAARQGRRCDAARAAAERVFSGCEVETTDDDQDPVPFRQRLLFALKSQRVLTVAQEAVVSLVYGDGLTVQQAAAQLARSLASTQRLLRRALENMRGELLRAQ